MAIFGRSFPMKSRPIGAISSVSLEVTETIDNVGVATHALTSAEAQAAGNSGDSTQALAVEATAEAHDNSATSAQALFVDATAETENNSGDSTQALTAEAEAESPQNSALAAQAMAEAEANNIDNTGTATLLTSDFETDDEVSTGTGDATISESTAESVQNIGGPLDYGEGPYGQGPYGFGEPHTMAEALAETITNSATSTPEIDEEVGEEPGDELTNIGVGSQFINEADAESSDDDSSNDQTLSENIAEEINNSATATIVITDADTDEEASTGTGSPTISESTSEFVNNEEESTQVVVEAIAEGVSNDGIGTPSVEEDGIEPSMVSVATSTQSLAEAIVEPNVDNSATATHTLGVDATAETESNEGTGSHELSDFELDTATNVGTGTPSQAEAVSETDTVEFLASHFIDDDITVRVVPISDLSTGTWTVAPLYEKVDEILALGGYPIESIRSGNNPSNDTAVMGLTPVSDPGINTNHFINIEFFKEGEEVVDLVVKLKEGSTVIAERTFSNVTETEEAPRSERIQLTELEAAAIVDYANLNIELVADQA